jgi:O-antigen/teichoic acid export membrane protein
MLKRQIVSDGMWISAAQLASAIGALATLRVLTELLTPETFGTLALTLGVSTLVQALLCTPSLHALLRYYPEYKEKARDATLCRATKRMVLRNTSYLLATGIAVAGLAYTWVSVPLSALGTILLGIFILVEVWRSFEVTRFNPLRKQKEFAAVTSLEAVGRPVLVWLALQSLGIALETVLLAFISASVVTAVTCQLWLPTTANDYEYRRDLRSTEKLIRAFSLPIVLSATIGWCNGTLDRYVIGIILGSGQVGVYAAAYGLVSRPFIMIGQVLEQTIRPVYYEATSWQDNEKSERYLRLWIILALVSGVGGFLFFSVFGDLIARLFLGEQFGQAVSIMPWIAFGYGVIGVVQALEKSFYAAYQTRQTLVIEMAGIGMMIGSLPFLIKSAGIVGAAIALCVGALVQISVSLLLIYRPTVALSPTPRAHVAELESPSPSARIR